MRFCGFLRVVDLERMHLGLMGLRMRVWFEALQVQSMLDDIKILDAAIGAGGQSAATPGDEIWAAADRCKSWQPQVQDMLMQVTLLLLLHGLPSLPLISSMVFWGAVWTFPV